MSALVRIARLGSPFTWRLAIAVLAGVAAAGAAIGLSATSAWLISRAAQEPPVLYLMVAVTGVRAFGVSRGVLRYAERLAAHDAAFRILGRLRAASYARLERLAPAGLAAFRSGDLLARLVSDVDGLADLWLRLLLPYAVALLAGAGAVALVAWLAPLAGLILLLTLLAVAFLVPLLTGTLARRAEHVIAGARGDLASATVELLAGASELLVAGAVEARVREVATIDARLASAEARVALGAGAGAFGSGLASGAAVWLGLLAGIAAVRAGSLDGVALAVVALTPIAAHEVVAALVPAAQHVPGLAAMAGRVVEVLDAPEPVVEPSAGAAAALPAGPLGLRFRGLRARYPGAPVDALMMPDLVLPAGGRLLVTGRSGSGKSTLAAVLLRFLDVAAGGVELIGADGAAVSLAAMPGDAVRSAIGWCAQDPHVFDSSVLENVRLARPAATTKEISAALAAAQLADWVATLPDGLDTLAGEHGARLSGGQRQRLALARALLADARIIVFDEPTEHLDEATAAALTADLLAATAGRTVVMITHRPELIAAGGWSERADLGRVEGPRDRPLARSAATIGSLPAAFD